MHLDVKSSTNIFYVQKIQSLNPIARWVPSQRGFLWEAPQRHIDAFSVRRRIFLLSESRRIKLPEMMAGPFFNILIRANLGRFLDFLRVLPGEALVFFKYKSARDGQVLMVFMISFEEAPLIFIHGRSPESNTPGNPIRQLAEWMHNFGRQKTVTSSFLYDFDTSLPCFISSSSRFVALFDIEFAFKFLVKL
jgi:hypothetical protein